MYVVYIVLLVNWTPRPASGSENGKFASVTVSSAYCPMHRPFRGR
jgi:hypothetical protein